jgi:putative membrane protein
MRKVSLVIALAAGATSISMAQAPNPQTTPSEPSAASSPHQREATGQAGTEATATENPEVTGAASPHQKDALGKQQGDAKMRMADKSAADPSTFVKKAALGGMTEVEVAKLAQSKSQDPKVQAFAQRMVKDHGKANQELSTLAKAKGWQVPASLDAEHKAVVEKLRAKSGAEFDAAYSQQMMGDHEKTIALFEGGSKASDAELAAWVKATLPTLKEHQQLAHSLPGDSHSASASTPQRQ